MTTTGRFVDGFALGVWQTNCYVLGDRELGRCVVVDPGQGGAEQVPARLAERDVDCEAILLTHGHLDHLWAVPELAAELDCPVFLHPEDRWLWEDPAAGFGDLPPGALEAQFGLRWQPPTDRLEELGDHQTLTLAGFRLAVRHTPGHTPGHCVFLLHEGDEPLLLSGDLLFAGSVGRTDFPRSSWEQQMASLERVVLPLPDETVVRPGHLQATTVGRERATNPFLRQLA